MVSGCESLLYRLGLVDGILCETNPFGALAARWFLVANHCYTGSGWWTEYSAKRTHSGRWRLDCFWLRIIVIRARIGARNTLRNEPISGRWRPAGFWLRIIVIRARVGARNTLRNEPIRGSGGRPVSGCESLLYGLGCGAEPFAKRTQSTDRPVSGNKIPEG